MNTIPAASRTFGTGAINRETKGEDHGSEETGKKNGEESDQEEPEERRRLQVQRLRSGCNGG